MSILTILKANIRHKKGTFVSIAVLLFVISMAVASIISIRKNANDSLQAAYDRTGARSLLVLIRTQNLTEELRERVQDSKLVQEIKEYPALASYKIMIGDKEVNNTWLFEKMCPEYSVLNERGDGYKTQDTSLQKGEIYVTQGILSSKNCKISDKIRITNADKEYEFTIKGIVEEPYSGASVIGWKQVFISDEDYEQIYRDMQSENEWAAQSQFTILQIQKADTEISDNIFKRQLNLETGITDEASGSMTKSMSAHYTMLFVSIITSVLLVFMGLLLIVVIIVITYSITTGIQMDYVNIGILKAVGITQGQLRLILILQYIAAEIVGMAAGLAGSVWLIKSFGTIFQPIMAVVITTRIAWVQSFFWIAVILVGTGILLFVLTAKAAKITPMRALSQGKDEIYFSSRLNVAVSQKHLYITLALRQITSAGSRYVGTVVIVAILVFFMMTIQILGGVVDSESARESMGEIVSDVEIQLQTKVDEHEFQNIERTIEEITPIQKKCYTNTTYMSLNGEEIYCLIYQNPGDMQMTKGRAPIYDNEIAITEITAEEVGIKMGDTVTAACGSNREEYLVSGIYQSLNDAGLNFSIGFQGAQKLGISSMGYGAYKLSEPEKAVQVQERLNEVYPEILKVQTSGDASMDKTYETAIQAMQLIVNVFSVLFALIVVIMFCHRMFLQEKTDIGILKAMGLISIQLRLSFGLRFLMLAVSGAVPGVICSVLLSGKLLTAILKPMGITHLIISLRPALVLFPIGLICVSFFLFAFLVSRGIKKLSATVLIAE